MRYLYLYFTLSLPYSTFTLLYLYFTLSLPYSTFTLPLSNFNLFLTPVFTPTFVYMPVLYILCLFNLIHWRDFDYPNSELLLKLKLKLIIVGVINFLKSLSPISWQRHVIWLCFIMGLKLTSCLKRVSCRYGLMPRA